MSGDRPSTFPVDLGAVHVARYGTDQAVLEVNVEVDGWRAYVTPERRFDELEEARACGKALADSGLITTLARAQAAYREAEKAVEGFVGEWNQETQGGNPDE